MIDWQTVIIAVVAAAPGALAGLAALIVAMRTHNVVNSRMDEFKRLFEASFIAQGELKEKTAEEGRKAAVAVALGNLAPTAPPTKVEVVGPGVETPLIVRTQRKEP